MTRYPILRVLGIGFVPSLLKTYGEKCFQFAGPKEWNSLPLLIRESPSIYIFKSRLKTYLFNCAFN